MWHRLEKIKLLNSRSWTADTPTFVKKREKVQDILSFPSYWGELKLHCENYEQALLLSLVETSGRKGGFDFALLPKLTCIPNFNCNVRDQVHVLTSDFERKKLPSGNKLLLNTYNATITKESADTSITSAQKANSRGVQKLLTGGFGERGIFWHKTRKCSRGKNTNT